MLPRESDPAIARRLFKNLLAATGPCARSLARVAPADPQPRHTHVASRGLRAAGWLSRLLRGATRWRAGPSEAERRG
jgi:hypothetical protein